MKVDSNVHSSPDGTFPPKTMVGLPLVNHNKISKKDKTKSSDPKLGDPKNGNSRKVGHSGSIVYMGIDNKTKRESNNPTLPKKGSWHPPVMTWR
eukprot:333946-Ditylum_brightwellii.AAC.1